MVPSSKYPQTPTEAAKEAAAEVKSEAAKEQREDAKEAKADAKVAATSAAARGTPKARRPHSVNEPELEVEGLTPSTTGIVKQNEVLRAGDLPKDYTVEADADSDEHGRTMIRIRPSLETALSKGDAVVFESDRKIEKGDPKCTHCYGSGEIMHGTIIPCPWCTKEGRERYTHLQGSK